MASLRGFNARRIAEATQSIEGAKWECTDEGYCYAIIPDRPGLKADLEAEGWTVRDEEYWEPEE
jgi:hypothetical protein